MNDLVVLTPGQDETNTLQAIISRSAALGIRSVSAVFQQHPERDAGCRLRAHDFLRRICGQFRHALVVFDREGCGGESMSRESIEQEVETRLNASGWRKRAAVVVIDPELEAWVWSNSPHVADVLGWGERTPSLHNWLVAEQIVGENDLKPSRPKEAVERVLRLTGKRRSASIYGKLAEKVSLVHCADPSFVKLRSTLQAWFSIEADHS